MPEEPTPTPFVCPALGRKVGPGHDWTDGRERCQRSEPHAPNDRHEFAAPQR